MPRVLLVGAYERDNLGDLLFLLVTERYLNGADVVAAAPFSADMRAQLGRKIPAYGPLLRSESFDAIWTVGGQVGRVDVARAYKMSARPRAYRRFERRSEASRARILRRAAGGPPPSSPYIPLPAAYPRNADAPAVINSVGIAGVRGIEPPRWEVRAVVNVAGFSHARSVRRNGAPLVLTSAPPRLIARRDVLLRQPMARRVASRIGGLVPRPQLS